MITCSMIVVSMTTKWQATIPAEIRKFLGLKPKQKIAFEIRGDQVVVQPVENFLALGGKFESKRKVKNVAEYDTLLGKKLGQNYEKEYRNS